MFDAKELQVKGKILVEMDSLFISWLLKYNDPLALYTMLYFKHMEATDLKMAIITKRNRVSKPDPYSADTI